jgi:hypothetical protein
MTLNIWGFSKAQGRSIAGYVTTERSEIAKSRRVARRVRAGRAGRAANAQRGQSFSLGVRFDTIEQNPRVSRMQLILKICIATLALSALSSCSAPLVRNTLALPGTVVRGAAHAVGMGGVGGL